MSSTFHSNLQLSIFGQSHGAAIGMTLDGLPAGQEIDLEQLQAFLARRAPGKPPWETPRKEADTPEFLSGLLEGKTCAAPITAIIRNTNTKGADYENLKDIPRPGHADFIAQMKHRGAQDVSGGGHFSGRLTAPLCIAGGICLQLLEKHGIQIAAHIAAIAGEKDEPIDPINPDLKRLKAMQEKTFSALDESAGNAMQKAIQSAKDAGDSVGGIVECVAVGLPIGLGSHMFDGVENKIARLAFAIPAVKGIEFGVGFAAADMHGSQHNDPFYWDGEVVKTRSNHHGGILGGSTSGMPLVFSLAIKPTPSIAKPQESVSLSKKTSETLVIHGRHDPCIVPRAVPCAEAVAAIALYDMLLEADQ